MNQKTLQPTVYRTWQLAWPLILGNISIPLLGLADTAIAGRIPGATDLATISLGASWITLLFWAFSFLRQSTGGLTAQAVGRDDADSRRGLVHKGLVFAFAAGFGLMGLGHALLTPLLEVLALETDLSERVSAYLAIRLCGAPAALTLYVLYGSLIGQGLSKHAVVLLAGMNILNLGLNAWLGLGLGWGAEGIAWGSLIAEYTAAAVALLWLTRLDSKLFETWQLQGIRTLLNANAWVMLRTLALLSVMTWMSTKSAQFGAQQAAITAVLMLLLNVAAYALDGFADAAEIQVGQSIGQGQPETVRLALDSTAWCSGLSALAASIGLFFASDALVWLLVPQPEIANAIQPWLVYVIPLPLVAWISYWLDGVFLGTGAFKQMAKVMLASTAVFFPLQLVWGDMAGLWSAFILWQLIRAGLMFWVYWNRLRNQLFLSRF